MGGNTSCVEIGQNDRQSIVIDAGTGLRLLGSDLLERSVPDGEKACIFLSHFHWDHIQGIPFFPPMYKPEWDIAFHAARPREEISRVVRLQTGQPYFSAEYAISAELSWHEIPRDGSEACGMGIRAFPLNHPGGSSGFRIEAQGHVIIYASDHEHGDREADRRVRDQARGADLLIWDSQYSPADYDSHRGWGHSTWQEGTRVAADAGVNQLVLFHHHPDISDQAVARVEKEARRRFKETVAAREGLVLTLGE